MWPRQGGRRPLSAGDYFMYALVGIAGLIGISTIFGAPSGIGRYVPEDGHLFMESMLPRERSHFSPEQRQAPPVAVRNTEVRGAQADPSMVSVPPEAVSPPGTDKGVPSGAGKAENSETKSVKASAGAKDADKGGVKREGKVVDSKQAAAVVVKTPEQQPVAPKQGAKAQEAKGQAASEKPGEEAAKKVAPQPPAAADTEDGEKKPTRRFKPDPAIVLRTDSPGQIKRLSNIRSLPTFSPQRDTYMTGATLTRDARLSTLFVDLFFMTHKAIKGVWYYTPTARALRGASEEWQYANQTMQVGVRDRAATAGTHFQCVIRLAGSEDTDEEDLAAIRAISVPTNTTIDGNANDAVNILRCEVPPGLREYAMEKKAGAFEVGLFEISEKAGAAVSLFNISVPIETRTTGLVSYPKDVKQDWWKDKPDIMHMCISGMRSAFVSPMAEMSVEFVEYHLAMGVSHIYMGVNYKWGSEDMDRFMTAMKPFVDEGSVSVANTDVIEGGDFGSNYKKYFFNNQCLYHAKSQADWVGVWDFDELLVPRQPGLDIPQIIKKEADPVKNKDKDKCFLVFDSFRHDLVSNHTRSMWLGERFATSRQSDKDGAWQKSLSSTRDVYFVGLHMPGACTCNGYDWNRPCTHKKNPDWNTLQTRVDHSLAAMFHFRIMAGLRAKPQKPSHQGSEYSMYHFRKVHDKLKSRGFEELLASDKFSEKKKK